MSMNRSARLCFVLSILLLVGVIGRNVYQRFQRASLFRAAEQGDVERLTSLLRQGVDVNIVNRYVSSTEGKVQQSPLLLAARAKRWEAVHLLLQAGADANFHDGGETVLGEAVGSDNVSMVQELLQRHADPKITDLTENPVLFSALLKRNVPIVQALLEAGADPNVRDSENRSALNFVISTRPANAKSDTDLIRMNLVRLLVAHGADVNAHPFTEYTPLMCAAQDGSREMVRFLLARGALPNVGLRPQSSASPPVITALSLARQNKRRDIVQLLQQAGATK